MTAATRQWKRRAEVIIGKAGSGIAVTDLRIVFEVEKTSDSAPNKATIKIYNLAPWNEEKIKHEFDEVLLNVGYEGNIKLLFRGSIRHVYRYFEKGNRITEIDAGDGEKDLRTAFVNETMAAGSTGAQMLDRVVGSMPNTVKGYVQIVDFERPRGRVLTGAVRDVIDGLANAGEASWSIQDGALNVVQANAVLPQEAIVVNNATGMIGTPEVNENGITAAMLLNPSMKVYALIKLDNNNIKELKQKKEPLVPQVNEMGEPQKLDPDGLYKITKITHKGDTRGKDWLSIVETVAYGAPQ